MFETSALPTVLDRLAFLEEHVESLHSRFNELVLVLINEADERRDDYGYLADGEQKLSDRLREV